MHYTAKYGNSLRQSLFPCMEMPVEDGDIKEVNNIPSNFLQSQQITVREQGAEVSLPM